MVLVGIMIIGEIFLIYGMKKGTIIAKTNTRNTLECNSKCSINFL